MKFQAAGLVVKPAVGFKEIHRVFIHPAKLLYQNLNVWGNFAEIPPRKITISGKLGGLVVVICRDAAWSALYYEPGMQTSLMTLAQWQSTPSLG